MRYDYSHLKFFTVPTKRAMVFIDGENLVMRYQDMIKEGKKHHEATSHLEDVYVWQSGFTGGISANHEILRTIYYTSTSGDDPKIDEVSDEISALQFERNMN